MGEVLGGGGTNSDSLKSPPILTDDRIARQI